MVQVRKKIRKIFKKRFNIKDVSGGSFADGFWEGLELGSRKTEKQFKRIINKVSTYKSEINNFVNIGRQNAINDIENEWRIYLEKFDDPLDEIFVEKHKKCVKDSKGERNGNKNNKTNIG